MAVSKKGVGSYFQKFYNAVGFNKAYNFILFFIFAGALMGFTLARLQFLSFDGRFCASGGAAPGECYYYTRGHYKIGIRIHLACILPAAFLICFQFVPVIRHKFMLFHRVNGYVIILLSLTSTAGALMVVRRAFGGTLSTQSGVGMLAIVTTTALVLAYYNIKQLQIDQHRAWMLRASFYMGSIITVRIIQIICALIISNAGGYYYAMPCGKVRWITGSERTTLSYFPMCAAFFNGTGPNDNVVITANMNDSTVTAAAALDISFGFSVWMALFIHAMGIEIYLRLTRRESAQLRQVSYERQLNAGFRKPGFAGLTFDRIRDDNKWEPNSERKLGDTSNGGIIRGHQDQDQDQHGNKPSHPNSA